MMRTRVLRASSWRTPRGRIAAVVVALGGLSALIVAPTAAVAAAGSTTASVISSAKNAKLGTILVATGDTVYTLKASKTPCTAQCLTVWRPVLLPQGATTATAGAGADASKLGTVAAANGALQVTYAGKPLYWFAKDTAPGQVHGNVTTKWGKWSTVVTAKASSGSNKPTPSTGAAGF